jgi:hypothetical protein
MVAKRNVRQQEGTIWNEVSSKTCCEDIRANYLYARKFVLKLSS